ncbi:hypothetical protein BDQ12DRAFT_677206 [Crucibulum laeve]|uniref:F-box domain-containing protein n=1 Tax=Crucibulum laeve TaxID=68775 RepID=A0A5C3MAN7_9AGAR|nr:hypothetical protein BDQ12DRAFT_677206 [Crucibulum laeve]
MSLPTHSLILDLPAEILLHILSYLDLPDLAALAQVAPSLTILTSDPVLHQYRIRIVSPSRVNHYLFGTGPQGHALRPTIGDLVHRGVIRGLGIERRWRMGSYFYSLNSIIQYENGRRLARRHTSHILSLQLERRFSTPTILKSLHFSHVLPDIESSFSNVARSLLPVMRKLKWSLQRDRFAKAVKTGNCSIARGSGSMAAWLENYGKGIVQDGEKVRLALCPDVRKRVVFYESLGRSELL